MGQIYRNAVLNLAAGGAQNSRSPLLDERCLIGPVLQS
jgi:hypothetical protein